jgi:hypothetical protein
VRLDHSDVAAGAARAVSNSDDEQDGTGDLRGDSDEEAGGEELGCKFASVFDSEPDEAADEKEGLADAAQGSRKRPRSSDGRGSGSSRCYSGGADWEAENAGERAAVAAAAAAAGEGGNDGAVVEAAAGRPKRARRSCRSRG